MNLKRDEQTEGIYLLQPDWEKREMGKSVQINAGRGRRSVTTVSGSRLSASFALLAAVNRPAQASAAPLLICCSHVSSYGRRGEGKEASPKG